MEKLKKNRFSLMEVSRLTGLNESNLITFIQREWISPYQDEILDEQDIARIHLIEELQHDFGANEEAIPLILHLVDQLCYFREQALQMEKADEE